MNTMWVVPCFYFLVCELFCTLLETVSIIFVVFIRFVSMSLPHARICGVLVGRCHKDYTPIMIRLDVPFVILRPKECEGAITFESKTMCAGVTVRSKLDNRDPALADRYFLVSEPFAPLYTILVYFLLSWTTLVCKKKSLVALSSFSLEKAVITIYNSLVETPLFPLLPFPRRPSLDLFSFSPTTGVPRSATLPHLSARGLPPDDDPGPQAENSSTSIFRNI